MSKLSSEAAISLQALGYGSVGYIPPGQHRCGFFSKGENVSVAAKKNCSIGLAAAAMEENEKNVEGKPIMQSVSSYVVTTTLVHKKAATERLASWQAPRIASEEAAYSRLL